MGLGFTLFAVCDFGVRGLENPSHAAALATTWNKVTYKVVDQIILPHTSLPNPNPSLSHGIRKSDLRVFCILRRPSARDGRDIFVTLSA